MFKIIGVSGGNGREIYQCLEQLTAFFAAIVNRAIGSVQNVSIDVMNARSLELMYQNLKDYNIDEWSIRNPMWELEDVTK